jgi:hypothetical protein
MKYTESTDGGSTIEQGRYRAEVVRVVRDRFVWDYRKFHDGQPCGFMSFYPTQAYAERAATIWILEDVFKDRAVETCDDDQELTEEELS